MINKEILSEYYNKNLSTNDLAKLFRVSKGSIYNWMKFYKIKTRSVSEGVTIAQVGKKHSIEWNNAISKGHAGKKRIDMSGRGNPIFKSSSTGMHYSKSGKRSDLGGLYVRSAWEANWARYLNFLVEHKLLLKWEYEPDTFEFVKIKKGCRFYKPDFKLFEPNGTIIYHEVKGYMDAKSATKIKRFKKYFPQFKLEIIDKDRYNNLKKQVCKIIPNWE